MAETNLAVQGPSLLTVLSLQTRDNFHEAMQWGLGTRTHFWGDTTVGFCSHSLDKSQRVTRATSWPSWCQRTSMGTQALKSGGYTGVVERLVILRPRKFRHVPKAEPGKRQLFQMAKNSPLLLSLSYSLSPLKPACIDLLLNTPIGCVYMGYKMHFNQKVNFPQLTCATDLLVRKGRVEFSWMGHTPIT